MKPPKFTSIFLALTVLFTGLSLSHAADPPTKEAKDAAKAVERMKDEKRRDEQTAKDCANRVRVARFDSVWRSPRGEDIDVLQQGEAVTKAHQLIALLTFDCTFSDETQAVAGFIEKAKDMGADGVLFLSFDSPNPAHPAPFSPSDKRVFRANAFVYQRSK